MIRITAPTPRPIRFTANVPAWRTILEALGGTCISEHPGWLVYQLGGGMVALHAGSADQPPGSTTLAIETPTDLATMVDEVAAQGLPITLEDSDHGPAGRLRAADGVSLWIDSATTVETGAGEAARRELKVLPIWHGPDTRPLRETLEGLGARTRVVGDAGNWADFSFAGGGLAAVHVAEWSGVELGFEWDGDVEEARRLLETVGVDCLLIDETYGRTLQFTDPDGGDRVWINEKQADLYGYTDASAS